MEDAKVYEEYLELPDGYQIHLMVLQEAMKRGRGRAPRQLIYRSRIWIGVESEEEARVHRCQEHTDLKEAVDACWRMLGESAARAIDGSQIALRQVEAATSAYFRAEPQPV